MKIGIITHHYVKNYGAFLQADALYKTLRAIYPQADIRFINFIIPKHWIKNILHILHFRLHSDTPASMLEKIRKLAMFSHYEHTLPRTRPVFTASGIRSLGLDLIVIGSDEVWDFEGNGYHPVKFGCGLDGLRLFAYAPSAGKVSTSSNIPAALYAGIRNFEQISVRDLTTQDLVRRISRQTCPVLPDPTLIYDFAAELSPQSHNAIQSDYILIYDCKLTAPMIAELRQFAAGSHYKLVGISDRQPWHDCSLIALTPYEWAAMFRDAALVITGTFHGTVFSIKYNRPFVSYPTEKNRINKISSLLQQMQLYDRMLPVGEEERFISTLTAPMDYTAANTYISMKQKEAIYFLEGFSHA